MNTKERHKKIEEIFNIALEISPNNRVDFINKVCKDDFELANEVKELLAFNEFTPNFIENIQNEIAKNIPVNFLESVVKKSSKLNFTNSTNSTNFTNSSKKSLTYFDNLINKKLNSTYLLQDLLGIGGMGAVFKATNLALGSKVAIKIISPKLAKEPTFIKRFNREASVGKTLKHPNIIKVFEFNKTEDGLFFIVMEYFESITLKTLLHSNGPMSINHCINILLPVCNALSIIHMKNILHRDLKPENILIGTSNGKQIIKIADFGIVKLLENTDEMCKVSDLSQGKILGTPQYMSPEQLMGFRLRNTSDIYSLGVILYEMLTLKLPFQADNPSDLLRMKMTNLDTFLSDASNLLSPQIDEILLKTLRVNPKERYQTANKFLEALEQLISLS